MVPDLEGVRKVEKVRVGYATVAKKVDAERLKKDLWDKLERTLKARRQSLAADEENEELMDEDDEKSLDSEPSTISYFYGNRPRCSFALFVLSRYCTQNSNDSKPS